MATQILTASVGAIGAATLNPFAPNSPAPWAPQVYITLTNITLPSGKSYSELPVLVPSSMENQMLAIALAAITSGLRVQATIDVFVLEPGMPLHNLIIMAA